MMYYNQIHYSLTSHTVIIMLLKKEKLSFFKGFSLVYCWFSVARFNFSNLLFKIAAAYIILALILPPRSFLYSITLTDSPNRRSSSCTVRGRGRRGPLILGCRFTGEGWGLSAGNISTLINLKVPILLPTIPRHIPVSFILMMLITSPCCNVNKDRNY